MNGQGRAGRRLLDLISRPRARRTMLVVLVLVAGYRSYGDSIAGWFREPDPAAAVIVTRAEFRPDVGGDRPVWFIDLENTSSTTGFGDIVLRATYFDPNGTVIETDEIVIEQRLGPGQRHQVASPDAEPRPGAETATVEVVGAEVLQP